MKKLSIKLASLILVLFGLVLSPFGFVASSSAEYLVTLTSTNSLVVIDSDDPSDALHTIAVTGLQSGETLVGIDFRPADGALYAVGDTSRLYTLNLNTGAATQVGTGQFSTLLTGSNFGMDFNPVVDRLRIVGNDGQNLRINPTDGTLVGTDTNLAYDAGDTNVGATPSVVACAYTNNFVGATSTTLYGVDSAIDRILTVGGFSGSTSPNTGLLFTRGNLAVASGAEIGFDISTFSGAAYLSLISTADSVSRLYSLSLGEAYQTHLLGTISTGIVARDISAPGLDSTEPTIVVTSPSTSSVRIRRATRAFAGTATDNLLISSVKYRTILSNGRATRYQTATGSTSWSFTATGLRRGRNRVQIKGVDLFGNESAVTTITVQRLS